MQFLEKPEPGCTVPRRPKREWKIPPIPASSAGEIEGIRILSELPDHLGLPLFQRARDLRLWATCDESRRPWLFQPGSICPRCEETDLVGALAVIDTITRDSKQTNPHEIAQACALVATWAERNGFTVTEAEFARLAAVVRPMDAALAFAAGRAARRAAQYEPAVEFFQRCIALARRAGEWAVYASAYLGWGVLEEQRGRRERAHAKFVRAYRAAKREQLLPLAGAARHNMIALCVPDRTFSEGQGHIVAAYKLYGPRNPDQARLAVDTACFWTWHGYFSTALPLFDAAVPLIERLPDRLQALANVARAAAVCGFEKRFHEVWEEVSSKIGQGIQVLPWVLIDIAYGAATLGYRQMAQRLVEQALNRARERNELSACDAALALQVMLGAGERPDSNRESPEEVQSFSRRFIARLRELT